MADPRTIIVFDSICVLCSASAHFIVSHDVSQRLYFVSMQSEFGRQLLQAHGIDADDPETFLLLKEGRVWTRSDAVFEIARDLGAWRWLRVFRFVPRSLRDWAYTQVARHRYRWFGRRRQCFVPSPEQRHRFLSSPQPGGARQ